MPDTPKTYPRPLSPHLQVYRPQLTSVLSISHRATGVVLYFGLLILAWWMFALATSTECVSAMQEFFNTAIGRLMILGWVFCLYYHLSNGVRHLFWDIGHGFELADAYRSGYAVVLASLYFTALTWYFGT